MELVKEDEKEKNYRADDFDILYRYKDTISGDNSMNVEELFYLIGRSVEITLRDSIKIIKASARFEFPANTYHKIKAITNIILILIEK